MKPRVDTGTHLGSLAGEQRDFSQFHPAAYLNEYYGSVGPENDGLLSFYASIYTRRAPRGRLFEVGGGPTLYSLASAARSVEEIHFSDALSENLDEIRRVLLDASSAFDWRPFVRRALEHEFGAEVSASAVESRLSLIKARVKRLMQLDVFESSFSERYDVVQANFVLDSITSDRDEWERLLAVLCSSITRGGELVMTALEGSRWWRIGDLQFPAVSLSQQILHDSLAAVGMKDIEIRRIAAEGGGPNHGYTGLLCVHAVRC